MAENHWCRSLLESSQSLLPDNLLEHPLVDDVPLRHGGLVFPGLPPPLAVWLVDDLPGVEKGRGQTAVTLVELDRGIRR